MRVASLLAHLGARETPYVRLAGVAAVALVVMLYSWMVVRLYRLGGHGRRARLERVMHDSTSSPVVRKECDRMHTLQPLD